MLAYTHLFTLLFRVRTHNIISPVSGNFFRIFLANHKSSRVQTLLQSLGKRFVLLYWTWLGLKMMSLWIALKKRVVIRKSSENPSTNVICLLVVFLHRVSDVRQESVWIYLSILWLFVVQGEPRRLQHDRERERTWLSNSQLLCGTFHLGRFLLSSITVFVPHRTDVSSNRVSQQ